MPLITSLLNWVNEKRLYQMDLFKKYPFDVQRDVLFDLIKTAKNTTWGQTYQYKNIHSVKAFQEKIPIQTYDDVKPFVEKMLKGEENLLWPGKVKWFAVSSGTTSDKSKYIPVSNEALEENHFPGGRDIFVIYMSNVPDSDIFSGKGLTLGGSHQINKFNNDSFYGDLSAILIENVPFWTHFVKTPNRKIALMDKWEKKLEEITRVTIKENVTNLMGVPSWNLILLKHILKVTGKNNMLEVWPNLELFIHGGGSFFPFREKFKKIIPSDNMRYIETYNASEGFFAIQDDLSRDDMMLILDSGIFYEFIPYNEIHKENPQVLHIGDVKPGENYAMLITTNSGLWRYMIGDTVIFTSTYPHRIKISGRTKHFVNAFGEELIIDNAEKALKVACEKTGAIIDEYTAAPVYITKTSSGRHEWLIEFNKKPSDMNYFATVLDNALKSVNSDYEAKRYQDITLIAPKITCLPGGTFYKWLETKGKLGGQNKVPRLYNDRKYANELIDIMDMVN